VTDLVRARSARLVPALVLGAFAIRLWHLLVMRQHIDDPGIVAMWLVGGGAAAVWALRPSRTGLVFIGLCVTLLFLFHWGYERAASDGREQFVQVRSLVMDHDLNFANEDAVLGTRGMAKMYPFGATLLWAPFMWLAHAWLGLLNLLGGSNVMDGYRNPYQRAIGLGTFIYGFIGLLLMWRLLRAYFDETIAMIATVAILFGTFLVWYVTVENSMTHATSFFATLVFLSYWHRGRPRADESGAITRPSMAWWAGTGLAAGLMMMVRWQNIAFPALAIGLSLWAMRSRWREALIGAAVCGACAFVAFFPQMVFWKIVRGGWLAVPTADHGFAFSNFHGLDVLFSSNHGLLSTTPLVYFAVLGLPFFIRRDGPMAIVLILGFVSEVFINGGNDGWWGGAGYAARRFDSCLPTFAIGLATGLEWLRRRPLVAPLAGLAGLLFINAVLMLDVRREAIPSAGAITFKDAMSAVSGRVGNLFSFPYNAYVAWKYDADWALYDRLRGRTYSNIEIDLGETGDDNFLGHGWLTPERDPQQSFRWASGAAASILVPLKEAAPYRLDLTCSPFVPPNHAPQSLTILVNGAPIATLTLQPGMAQYQVPVPASALRRNLNGIRFEFGYSMSPRDAGLSNDARSLAVMFDRIKMVRVTGG
jgi:hypothetical protein